MNKKVLFVFASALFTLASCGENSATSSTGTTENAPIVVWGPSAEQPVVESIVNKYNEENPDDKIQITFNICSEADGGTTLANDPKVKNYPSLFAFADDHLGNLVSKNIVRKLAGSNLTSVTANDTSNSIESASYTVDGETNVYAYPISTDNGYFLYYDGSILSDDDVKTFEGMLAKSKEKGKVVIMDVPNGWYAASFFLAQGVCGTDSLKYETVKKEDGSTGTKYTINWDNDAGAAMAKATSDLFTQYNSSNGGTFINGDDKVIASNASNGSLAAVVTGTWNESSLKEKFGELKAVKLPTLNGHQLGSFSGTKLYGVNAYATSSEQKTAHKLAKLLTNKEAQITRYTERSAFPCNKEALADPAYTANQTVGGTAFVDQAQYSAIQSRAAQDRYWDIGKAIGQVMYDGYTTADGTTKTLTAVEDWKAFITSQISSLREVK